MSSKRIQKIKEQIIESLSEKPKPFGNIVGGFISTLIGIEMLKKKQIKRKNEKKHTKIKEANIRIT